MFSGYKDQFMVMRAALSPVRLTKWQIVRLVAKQICRQISFAQATFVIFNLLVILYGISLIVHRLFFHPLAKYPGPRLAAASEIWYIYHWLAGRYPWDIEELHQQYGPVIRIAPDELSFASAYCATEIYGQSKNNAKFFKKVQRSALDNGDIRKTLPQIFTSKFIEENEDVLQRNVDSMISSLGQSDAAMDISKWYGWLTFDIMGEWTLGSSFKAMKQGMPHLWLETMQDAPFYQTFPNIIRRLFPYLFAAQLLNYLPLNRSLASFHDDTIERLRIRESQPQSKKRVTFADLLAKKHSRPLSADVLGPAANSIVQAGTLPMTTLLTATTYALLAHPVLLERTTDEIRRAYSTLRQINIASTKNIKTLSNIIEESMRIFPPNPFSPVAVNGSPHETVIAGRMSIPSGTIVSSASPAISHSSLNFTSARTFLPQRWLPEENDTAKVNGVNGYNKYHTQQKRFASDTLAASKPFGLGPWAVCPGVEIAYAEARVILAKMLWAFDLECDEDVAAWETRTRWNGNWKFPAIMVRLVPYMDEGSVEVL